MRTAAGVLAAAVMALGAACAPAAPAASPTAAAAKSGAATAAAPAATNAPAAAPTTGAPAAAPTAAQAASPAAKPTAAAPAKPTLVNGKLPALADGFPNRPITLWNSFEPGHTDDLFNNVVAEIGSRYSPVRLTTSSHPSGAKLQYGMVDFLRTQQGADQGYHTYAISWFGPTVRLYTLDQLKNTPMEVLEPVNSMQQAPYAFAVRPNSEFKSLAEIEAWAKANPKQLKVVGSTVGSGLHSSLLAWANQAKIEVTFIPTSGAGESRQTLLGEGAQLACLTYEPGMDKNLRVLAVTGSSRMSTMRDVPAVSELGYNVPSGSDRGYGTIQGVPKAHIEWLAQLFALVAQDPEFISRQPGFDVVIKAPEQVRQTQQEIVRVFIPVLRETGQVVR